MIFNFHEATIESLLVRFGSARCAAGTMHTVDRVAWVDKPIELHYFDVGNILPYVRQRLLKEYVQALRYALLNRRLSLSQSQNQSQPLHQFLKYN